MLKSKVYIACVDCGKIFLQAESGDFLNSQFAAPPREYWEAAVHCFETGHTIIGRTLSGELNLSTFWRTEAEQANISDVEMLRVAKERLANE